MSEQRFQPVKGLNENIKNTAIEAGQFLIATDTGQMYLDISNQERILIGGSGVAVLYGNDPAPVKVTDLQYTLTRNGLSEKVKADDLIINVPDGAFYKVISLGTTYVFCQRLAISGSGTGGGDQPAMPKVGFVNKILTQLKNLYVYGEHYSLTIIPYAENDTTVTVTVSLIDDAETSVDVKPYYEYKKTVPNNYELIVDLGSHFQVGSTRIDIKLESLNSGSDMVRYGGQQIVELRLDDGGFNPEKVCTANKPINFSCKPVGAIQKILHILIDGFEIKTQEYGSSFSNNTAVASIYSTDLQTHGVHSLDAYLTATVNGKTIESNHLNYEIAYAAEGNNSPIIWFMNKPTTIEQYEDIIVQYMVYDPVIGSSGTMTIDQLHDGLVITTLDEVQYSESTPFTWVIADSIVGDNYYGISCKGVTESFVITVTPSARDMDYVQKDQMIINLNANGRTNNESLLSRQKWQYTYNNKTEDCILNNFNWHTNGWNTDSEGKSYLKISDGASVQIPLSEAGQVGINLNQNGSQNYTFEFRLKIRNITSYDTLIKNTTKYKLKGQDLYLSWDELVSYAESQGSKDPDSFVEQDEFQSQIIKVEKTVSTNKGICVSYLSDSKGFALGTQESYFGTGQEYVNAKYKEDEIFNISYVVSSNNNPSLSRVYIYVNGLLTGISTISSSGGNRGFSIPVKYITINSQYCDVDLYAVRVYNGALDSWSIVQNYLSDLRNIIDYDQNQISNNINNLTVIDYNKLLQYNQTQRQNGRPDLLTMPYLIIQTVDNIGTGATYGTDDGTPANEKNLEDVVPMPIDDENLPYLKGKARYVKTTFVNPALDYAYENGDLDTITNKLADMTTADYYAYHCPSFIAYGGELDVQGTSSQAYPRRNYKLKLKNADYWRYNGGPRANTEDRDITGKGTNVWCMDIENSVVHNNKFTLKIDFMESSGSYNTGFANMVHYMYEKHPLDYYKAFDKESFSGIEDNILKTYRTSVQGFPVLTFHAVKNNSGGLDYQYIGRYNMNLDKGSDDSYGFKYDGTYKYNEEKKKMEKVEGSDCNPFAGGKAFKKIVECWEMADNQGNYCSFKFPYEGQTGFSEKDKGRLNNKGILEIIDHLEYRYNSDDDNLDICYAGVEGAATRGKIESPLYEDDIEPYEDQIKQEKASIKQIREANPELDSQLTALEEKLETTKDKDEKKKIQKQIDELEAANGIDVYRNNIAEQEKLIDAQSEAKATKADYNSLILKRYKNIEKLYKWFQEVDIAANSYTDEENLLYGDTLKNYRQKIADAQAQIDTLNYLINSANKDIETLQAKLATDTTLTEEEKQSIQNQIADLQANIETNTAAIPEQQKIIEDTEAAITAQKEQGPIEANKEAVAKYTFDPPKVIDGTTYNYDTREYRRAKFISEFDKHLNKEYCLVYFIMTELLLCYDSRGKNMMIASWGPMEKDGEYIWFPIFYDIDTQLGINNTGIPTWDYDVDASVNAAAGAETFSTANSVLWYNLLYCFLDEIKQKYQQMRLANLNENFIEKAYRCSPEIFTTSYACKGVRPLVALNSDFEYKYILPTLEVGKGTDYGYINTAGNWVQDNGNSFFYACQGDRDLSRQLLIRNRMNYLDSEMQANIYSPTGASSTTSLKLRASANSTSTSDRWLDVTTLTDEQKKSGFQVGKLGANPSECLPLDGTPYYQITPFLSQYVSMYYDDTTVTVPQKFTNTMQYILPVVPENVLAGYKTSVPFTQQLVYIPGANYLSKVSGLDMKYIDEIQLQSSIRLTELVLGNDDDGYYNENSVTLSLADSADTTESPNENAKTLLKKVVLTGLKNIKADSANIDISGSAKIEEFRALNTNITGCKVAIGAPISIMHLPSTVTTLALNTNYNLINIITEKISDNVAENAEVKGLYIDGLTNIIDRSKTITELIDVISAENLALSTIEIKNDSLGYDSYQIVKTALARKIKKTTPTNKPGLALRLENVQWTPFELLDTAAVIDGTITYYELNDHYQYVEIDPSDETFINKRKNSLIFIKNADKDGSQIPSMEIIDKFVQSKKDAGSEDAPQFHDTVYNTNMPYVSGEIYVDNTNGTEISEVEIQTYNVLYPSLDIRVAKVQNNYTIKYIQVDDVTGLTKVYEAQKALHCEGRAYSGDNEYFSNPNRNITLVPSKNNYDFYGWSKDGTKEGVIISPKQSDDDNYYDDIWMGINFEELAVDNVVTLYAVFELHKYKATFYNYDGTELGTTETPYSRTNPVNVIKILPSKPADDLDLTGVWGFAGWAMRTAPSRVLDMANVHPIMDYEFIAVYEEKSVYSNVLDSNYLSFVQRNGGYYISVASGVQLSGKITLPTTYNDIDIIGISAGGFAGQNKITHIFYSEDTNNRVATIEENAFRECLKLVYYEMSTVAESVTLGSNSFYYTNIIQNLSAEEQKMFFSRVTRIEANAFAINFSTGNFSLQTLYLPGNLIFMDSGAFRNHKALTQVYIGSSGNPSQLSAVGDGPFGGCGSLANVFKITYYYSAGQPYSDQTITQLKFGLADKVIATATVEGILA